MKKIRRISIFCFLFIVAVTLISCGSSKFAKNRNYDYTRLQKIAVLPLTGHAMYGETLADAIGTYLMDAGYTIIERNKIDKILSEQSFSMVGLLDESQIIKTGKLLGADAMIVGYIVPKTAVWRNWSTNQVYIIARTVLATPKFA